MHPPLTAEQWAEVILERVLRSQSEKHSKVYTLAFIEDHVRGIQAAAQPDLVSELKAAQSEVRRLRFGGKRQPEQVSLFEAVS